MFEQLKPIKPPTLLSPSSKVCTVCDLVTENKEIHASIFEQFSTFGNITTGGGELGKGRGGWTCLEQHHASVVHLPVVVVHDLLGGLAVVHVWEIVAPGPKSIADLLDLGLDRSSLHHPTQNGTTSARVCNTQNKKSYLVH